MSPDAGYFVEDDIAIGAWVPLSLDLGDNYRVIGYGIVPFFRYYVDQMDDMMYFITANIGFTGNATKIGGVSDSNTGLVGGAGMGVTYMLTESVGVEGIIGYSFNKYKDVDLQSRIGIDIGFQVYFNP